MSAISFDLGLDVKDLYRAVIGMNTKSTRGIGFDSVENTPGLPPIGRFHNSEHPGFGSMRFDDENVIPEEEHGRETARVQTDDPSQSLENSEVVFKAEIGL